MRTVGIQVVQFIVFAVLSRYPQVHNYPIAVTDGNREGLYQESRLLLARLALLVSLLFALIFVSIVGGGEALPTVAIGGILVLFSLMIASSVCYFRRLKAIDKQSKGL